MRFECICGLKTELNYPFKSCGITTTFFINSNYSSSSPSSSNSFLPGKNLSLRSNSLAVLRASFSLPCCSVTAVSALQFRSIWWLPLNVRWPSNLLSSWYRDCDPCVTSRACINLSRCSSFSISSAISYRSLSSNRVAIAGCLLET